MFDPEKEKLLREALYDLYDKTKQYNSFPGKFMTALQNSDNVVQTVKKLIMTDDTLVGLKRLKKVKKIRELSIESVILRDEFENLFTQDELDAVSWKLNLL